MSIESLGARDFFPELDSFAHARIFDGVKRPWEVLGRINGYILDGFPQDWDENVVPVGVELLECDDGGMLYCTSPVRLESRLVCPTLKVCIGAGTRLEPTAVVKGPTLIGDNCEVRHGAYIRGGVIAGDRCTLGHATEIKNSILMNHTEAGHFNYIGDTVLGSYVNLGAGTKMANLKFRTAEQKKKEAFPELAMHFEGRRVKTGVSKFGAIMGDFCETGCNAVTSPALMLGPNCIVYPNVTVPGGYYEAGSIIRP